jgi:hypothetical protein
MAIDHISNRSKVAAALVAELMGPAPSGDLLDLTKSPFEDKPWVYKWDANAEPEEVLRGERPHMRYGVGVLYPPSTTAAAAGAEQSLDEAQHEVLEQPPNEDEERETNAFRELDVRTDPQTDEDEQELVIDSANKFQPGSFGISFLIDLTSVHAVNVRFTGGRYDTRELHVYSAPRPGQDSAGPRSVREQSWFFRRPVSLNFQVAATDIAETTRGYVKGEQTDLVNLDNLSVRVRCFVKKLPNHEDTHRLLTVIVANESSGDKMPNCVFQSRFGVCLVSVTGQAVPNIMPYPEVKAIESDEDSQFALLYRDCCTYAVGHGCAADWKKEGDGRVAEVFAEPLPFFETPSTTTEITYINAEGLPVTVPEIEMNLLADPDRKTEAISVLNELVDHYFAWEESIRREIEAVPPKLQTTASSNLDRCRNLAEGLRRGIQFLNDDMAYEAFRMANHAMLLQRFRSKLPVRRRSKTGFGAHPSTPELSELPSATWRPFQIAFLLLAMRSTVLGHDQEREYVELIWFPTGGGKTEAYLGLAAIACIYRRLENSDDIGTTVLMRYTLRLLTQQQLLRAASLVCALEYLRTGVYAKRFGPHRFTIGLWVGGSVTPGARSEAIQAIKSVLSGKRSESNFLVLTRCPWCGAEMKIDFPSAKKGIIDGAKEMEQTVRYVCPDDNCHFNPHNEDVLPVEFIDEEIYSNPPTIVIGTIDKFATMHSNKAINARSLFGFASGQGEEPATRVASPPSLIIQDELHLISGPLGSTAGLYECLIEELCTDARKESRIRPKIVCSTATIRGYSNQVLALYARKNTRLFPPSGIDAGDSFFAQYARFDNGSLLPGRLYVGVHPTGFSSGQTSRVRTFSALLQAPVDLVSQYPECSKEDACPFSDDAAICDRGKTTRECRKAQDPWWTLVIFFNSLRDLGNAISLFQTDMPDYRRVVRKRRGVDIRRLRHAYQPMELTSRLRNTEIPERLAALEVTRDSDSAAPPDVCLASNIIEVGIDVDRMALLCVVAQPKTTATYIQVTGRVGRSWKDKPGLVVTIYAADRPRDRSHFEHFRSYHERLYAQVEPTSVTPYSRPLLERALHGVIGAYIRLLGTGAQSGSPSPFPEEQFMAFIRKLLARARRSGFEEEEATIKDIAALRLNMWKQKGPERWLGDEPNCLLEPATGNPLREQREDPPFSTSYSMRNVDAPCEMRASDEYMNPIAYPVTFEVDDE